MSRFLLPPAIYSTLTATAAVGELKQGVLSDAGTNSEFIRFTPAGTGTSWIQGVNSAINSPGPRPDITMTMGWNLGVGGGRAASGALNGALGLSFEEYYETVGGNKVMEQHNIYVSPADVQTRYVSFMGNLEAPYDTSLFIYSSAITLGYGRSAQDPGSIFIGQSETKITVPSGYPRLSSEGTAQTIGLYNGDVGNSDRGHLIVYNTGEISLSSDQDIRLAKSGAVCVEVLTGGTIITSADGTSGRIYVTDGSGPIFYAGGSAIMYAQTSQVYSPKPIRSIQGAIGETSSAYGFSVYNGTAANVGAQQWSPVIDLRSSGWKTSGGGASQANGWGIQAQSVQGATNSSVNLAFMSSINEAALSTRVLLTSDGGMQLSDGVSASVGAPGTGALRYNNTTKVFEQSLDAAAWVTLGGGGSGDMVLSSVQSVTGAKTFNASKLLVNNAGNTFASTLASLATAARTWSLPDATDTAVGLATTQTLTNKTITDPVLSGTTTGSYTLGGSPTLGSNLSITAGNFVSVPTNSATVPPSITWTAVTFENSWVNFDTSTFYGCGYYKDIMGFVRLRGQVKDGTPNVTIFTLPAGYRPSKKHIQASVINGSIACYIDIAPTGEVTHNVAANSILSLDGIVFYAEQ